MNQALDFGEDWESEEEKHEHCVVTEGLCAWLAHSPHGHPGGCCTCDEAELPVYLSYGYPTEEAFAAAEGERAASGQSLLAYRMRVALEEGREGPQGLRPPSDEELIRRGVPVPLKGRTESLSPDAFTEMPNRPPRSVYEQIARDSQAAPRIVMTSWPPERGRMILAHKFTPNATNECTRCTLPRTNRIHQAAEIDKQPPVLQALIDAVTHICDEGCYSYQCHFDYRAAVRKVRRILGEVTR